MPFISGSTSPDHRVGGDRRVDRVAAALKDLHAGLRGERLAGGDDAEFRGDFRAPRERSHSHSGILHSPTEGG